MAIRITQDHPRPKEADAGQDSLQHSSDRIRVDRFRFTGESERNHRGHRCAQTNQTMGTQPGGLAVQFPIQTERASDNEGRAQSHRDFAVAT